MAFHSVRPVYKSVRLCLAGRPHIGALKALLDLILEPINPFDPNANRSPRRWFVLFSLVSVLGVGCFFYFNLLQ